MHTCRACPQQKTCSKVHHMQFKLHHTQYIMMWLHSAYLCFSPSAAPHSFRVSVQYLGQDMLAHEVQDNSIRVSYCPVAPVPPSPSSEPTFHRIPLPDPPCSMPSEPRQAISTLLPFMEKGVMLTSAGGGVYAKRSCQGRVFWRGPHTHSSVMHKMERTPEPVMVFSRETFQEGEESSSSLYYCA